MKKKKKKYRNLKKTHFKHLKYKKIKKKKKKKKKKLYFFLFIIKVFKNYFLNSFSLFIIFHKKKKLFFKILQIYYTYKYINLLNSVIYLKYFFVL